MFEPRKPADFIYLLGAFISTLFFILYVSFYFVYGPLTHLQETAYTFFTSSQFIFLIATFCSFFYFLGTFGRRNKFPHGLIILIGLCIGLTFNFIGAIMFIFPPSQTQIQIYFDNYLVINFGATPPFMDQIQRQKRNCCGIRDYLDYNFKITEDQIIDFPESCCIKPYEACGNRIMLYSPTTLRKKIFTKGCFSDGILGFGDKLKSTYSAIGILPLLPFLFHILTVALFSLEFKKLVDEARRKKRIFSQTTIVGQEEESESAFFIKEKTSSIFITPTATNTSFVHDKNRNA